MPAATGALHVLPSMLTAIEYLPIFPFLGPSDRGRYDRPAILCVSPMSMVMTCGSGTDVPAYRECQIVVAFPSSTPSAGQAGASSLAVAVQPALGSAGGAAAPPTRPISAAYDHGPRLPASVSAVRRT